MRFPKNVHNKNKFLLGQVGMTSWGVEHQSLGPMQQTAQGRRIRLGKMTWMPMTDVDEVDVDDVHADDVDVQLSGN